MAGPHPRQRRPEVLVLGPLLVGDGRRGPLPVRGPQQQRLVGALAVEPGHTLPVSRLIEILWPDGETPANPHAALQTYVWRLRQVLGRDGVRELGGGYALDDEQVHVDHLAFTRSLTAAAALEPTPALACLDEALAMWRGQAWGTLHEQWWARPSAERLARLRLDAMTHAVDLALLVGPVDDAQLRSEVLLAADPLREASVLRRATVLERAGRPAEALRATAAFRTRLAEATGLNPSERLSQLEQRIATGTDRPARTARGFELQQLLAHDDHTTVHLAVQPALGREVTVTTFSGARVDQRDFIQRFETEAQAIAQLEHPHIATIHDYWREPGSAVVISQRLRGGSLTDRLRSGPAVTVADLDRIVLGIASALGAAHRRGVVHHRIGTDAVAYDEEFHVYLQGFAVAPAEPRRAEDDVVELAEMVMSVAAHLAPADLAPVASVLRRAQLGELDAEAFVDGWRTARGLGPERTDGHNPTGVAGGRGRNPFKGLRPFLETDRSEFFGRAAETAELTARLIERRFVAVVGPSGSGKSSLLAAGVIPAMRRLGFTVTSLVPGPRPVNAAAAALRRIAAGTATATDDELLAVEHLAHGPPLLVVIDQFEELWSMAPAAERDELLSRLTAALDADSSRFHLLVALRADRYDQPLATAELAPRVAASTFPLHPLGAAGLEEAVTLPLRHEGLTIESGLTARIVMDLVGQPGALPLLQFCLSALTDRSTGGVLRHEDYDELGGALGALAHHAEAIASELGPASSAPLRQLFGRLVSPGTSVQFDARRRVALTELDADCLPLVERLRRSRLLITDRNPVTGEPTVEVAHEELFRRWPRLAGWIEEDRIGLRRRADVEAAAHRWSAAGHDDAYLLTGSRLAEATDLAASTVLPRPAEIFVAAAQEREQAVHRARQRRLRRMQLMLASTAAALVAALVAASTAVVQHGRAEDRAREANANATQARAAAETAATAADAARRAKLEADLRRLAGVASSLADEQPDLAMLLAAEVGARRPGPDSDAALVDALTAAPEIDRIIELGLRPQEAIRQVASSPTGRLVLQTSTQVVVVDAATMTIIARWPAPDPVASIAIAPDGAEVAAVGSDGRLERHDARSGLVTAPSLTVAPLTVFGRAAPVAYLADGALAVGNGRTLEVYPRGSAVPSIRRELTGTVATIVATADTGRLIVSTAPDPSGTTWLIDLDLGETVPLGGSIIGGSVEGTTATVGFIGPPSSVARIDTVTGVVTADATIDSLVVGIHPNPDGTVLVRTIFDAVTVLDAGLQQVGTFRSLVNLIGRAPDGTPLGALGSRLVVVDPRRLPRLAETIGALGPVRPRVAVDRVYVDRGGLIDTLDADFLADPRPVTTPKGRVDAAALVAVSPDGHRVAVRAGGKIEVYDTEPQPGVLLAQVPDAPTALFSPDGSALAIVSDERAARYDLADGAMAWSTDYELQLILGATWGDDGRWIVIADIGAGNVLLDADTGRATPIVGYGAVFLDDGELLLGGAYEPMRRFDPELGQVDELYLGAQDPAALVPLPGGDTVLRLANDGQMELFDLAVGRRIGGKFTVGLRQPMLAVPTTSVAPDGTMALIASAGEPVVRVELDRQRWIELACAAAGRRLTETEWREYLADVGPYAPTC